jgi:peptide/nickel transport system permease protein
MMGRYLIKRMLILVPTLFLVSITIFLSIRFIPGDVIDMMAQGESWTKQDRKAIEHKLGLDVPLYTQYGRWMEKILLHADFGDSLWGNIKVMNRIRETAPVSVELTILAMIISLVISLPIGIYSAMRQDTVGDYLARSFAMACIAVPSFWLGTVVIVFPAIWWGWSPPTMYTSLMESPVENLLQLSIPAIILGMSMAGVVMRMTSTMMLEVLRQDYIRTAWAKGLKERIIIVRHALKNAFIPIITIIGLQIPTLIGGAVIIEQIFGLPGMGRLIVESAFQRDYPMVSGTVLVMSVGVLLLNLIVDMTYGFLNPKIVYD